MKHTPTPWKPSEKTTWIIKKKPDPGGYARYPEYIIEGFDSGGGCKFTLPARRIGEACNAHDRFKRENKNLRRTLNIIRDERDGLLKKAIEEARAKKAITLCEKGKKQ